MLRAVTLSVPCGKKYLYSIFLLHSEPNYHTAILRLLSVEHIYDLLIIVFIQSHPFKMEV